MISTYLKNNVTLPFNQLFFLAILMDARAIAIRVSQLQYLGVFTPLPHCQVPRINPISHHSC